MTLREMLHKDFGIDLPIAGGWGQSADDPIVLTSQDPDEAALVQLEIARRIYGVQGWYWRQIERTFAGVVAADVEKFSSEVKYIEDDQIVTEIRNLYFDLSSVIVADEAHLENPSVPVGPPAELNFPRQIGWFHFDGLTNNEPEHPGLGVSIAYSAPKAKMMIYAYDKGLSDQINDRPDESASSEYAQAIADFRSMNPEARPAREHEQGGVRLSIFESGQILSVVLVSPFRDFFFKLRLTLDDRSEQFMVDCAMHTLSNFVSMVGTSNQTKH